MDEKTTVLDLINVVKEFCEVRDWSKFHSPKELAIGISTEAGELLAHFRFKDEIQMKEMFKNKFKREKISDELADVLFFILRFAQMNEIDLSESLINKVEKSNKKYPIDKVKGLNKKYNEY